MLCKSELFSSPFSLCWLSLGEVNLTLPLFVFILTFPYSKLHESVHLQGFSVFFVGFGVCDAMDDVELL